MKQEVIKRSIRIPYEIDEELKEESRRVGKTVNQIILEICGEAYGIEVRERRRGRRWYK